MRGVPHYTVTPTHARNLYREIRPRTRRYLHTLLRKSQCFTVDESINYLLPSLLQVIPEGFPGDAHHISSPVLLDTEEIAKTDSFKLFYRQVIISRSQRGISLGLKYVAFGRRDTLRLTLLTTKLHICDVL